MATTTLHWLDRGMFATVVDVAVRAPSMHNSQPWRFRLRRQAIDVLADPDRALPAGDPTGWAARVACGAALVNLRLALAVHNLPTEVELLPDAAHPELLATLRPTSGSPPTPAQRRLVRAIPHRHTNRHPFDEREVPIAVRATIAAAARTAGGRLTYAVGPLVTDAVAHLVRAADLWLNGSGEYQAEVATWVRDEADPADGVPAECGLDLLCRAGGHPAREPLLAVLSTTGGGPADDLHAGQALQHVLLTATDLGLAASLYSQPIEVPRIRAELGAALHTSPWPQMVLRLGYAPAAPATGRRPVADVIEIAG